MNFDPKSVQDTLHQDANLPGNFNPANGKWEAASSGGGRTQLMFDPVTKKLVALTPQQVAANAARRVDGFVGVDMAREGFFNLGDTLCILDMGNGKIDLGNR